MGWKMSDANSLYYGIVLSIALISVPTVWSAAGSAEDVSAGQAGPGANPVTHEIPPKRAELEAWLHRVTMPVSARPEVEPNLVTAENKMEIIKVRKDGSGKFKNIMDAVNSVENKGNDNRVIIDIGPGTYKEQVKIDRYRPYITLYGSPVEKPVITFDAEMPKYEMTETPTLDVAGDYFCAVNIVVMNEAAKEQHAIAVRVSGNYAAFYNVVMSAKQNTLLDDTGNHFYVSCLIEGAQEFIIGDARSIFLNTTIKVIPNQPVSIITAQARKNTDPNGGGFVFVHCMVSGQGKALLGRTFTAGSRVIFAYTFLPAIIEPKGWYDDFDTDYEKTAFFGEYKNVGPSASLANRVDKPCTKKVTEADVKPFLNLDFINAAEWLLPPVNLAPRGSKSTAANP